MDLKGAKGMKIRKIVITILVLIIISVVFSNYNTSPKTIITNLLNQSYIKDGDLQYRVYLFGVLPVGNATIYKPVTKDFEGKKAGYLYLAAENTKLTKLTFNGRAKLESYIDAKLLKPIIFKQTLSIKGQKDINKEVRYDYNEGTMTINGVKRNISNETFDPLSAILNIRRLDFGKTNNVELNINTNQKTYLLKGNILLEPISIRNQSFTLATLKSEIKRKDGNPYHKSSITAVFLKDQENIPILIKIFSGGVFLKIKLVKIR